MLTKAEAYAIELSASAIESTREDDLNEDGVLTDEEHETALELARMIRAYVENCPYAVLAAIHEVSCS